MQGSAVDPNLIAIKQREQTVKDAIRRGEPMIDLQALGGIQFTDQQLGLRGLVGDEWGRIWRADRGRLVMVFSPKWMRLQEDRAEYDGK